jgi:glycerate 2-kinase
MKSSPSKSARSGKEIAREIFLHALSAIDIPSALARHLDRAGNTIQCAGKRFNLSQFSRIETIAFGKAAFPMAESLISILAPEFKAQGILVVPTHPPREIPGWRTIVAGHPVPDANSFAAGRAILDLLATCDAKTLVFFLISGGGSALVEAPLDPELTLADFQKLHSVLVSCGAPIEEINVIRKHLSATKGGRLAAAASDAMKLTLAISDVPEGHESALASGPTLPDPTTLEDAERIAAKYGLVDCLPLPIAEMFLQHRIRETPKHDDPAFEKAWFELILRPHDLRHSAHHASEAGGYICICDDSTDGWPVDKAAECLLELIEKTAKENPGRRIAVVSVGELSSPVTGDGVGGRSSAFALCCVEKIAGKNIAVLSAGTDGIDGNSPAAGAVADGQTLARAQSHGMEPAEFFRRSDAYSFFSHLGDAIVTGPTGNNLRDLRVLLAG